MESMDPAIDPILKTTGGKGCFWTSTTAGHSPYAWYVAFGRATDKDGSDKHGAGSARNDPKSKASSFGGKDENRVLNYARCVRGGPASR